MKILQINATYGMGSTGNIVRDIKRCCGQHGIDCQVAYQYTAEDGAGYKIGNGVSKNLHSLLCRIGGKEAYFSTLATRKLIRHMDDVQPDIVHLHNLHSHYINLNLILDYLAKQKTKTVITLHDCWYFTGGCFHYAHVGCERWQQHCGQCPQRYQATPAYLYDGSARVLADRKRYLSAIDNLTIVGASQWIADEAKKSFLGEKRVCCIHNGFDLEVFKPTPSNKREAMGLMGKQVILGPASKWLTDVNNDTLHYFATQLDEDQVLLLFGAARHEEKLPKNVMVYGYTHNKEELAQLYTMADIMVNCSREDTLSSINLEAQACGTPVVTYDATGSRETVNEGFAVETGNYEMLWSKTYEVLSRGKAAYAEACRSFIAHDFELNNNYDKYIQLYNSLTHE